MMAGFINIFESRSFPKMFNLWEVDLQHMTLTLKQGLTGRDGRRVPQYEIDLGRCRTSAMMLDWIMQIAGKSWATKEILGDLVYAFNQILRPQANLCSMGSECGPIDPREVISNRMQGEKSFVYLDDGSTGVNVTAPFV